MTTLKNAKYLLFYLSNLVIRIFSKEPSSYHYSYYAGEAFDILEKGHDSQDRVHLFLRLMVSPKNVGSLCLCFTFQSRIKVFSGFSQHLSLLLLVRIMAYTMIRRLIAVSTVFSQASAVPDLSRLKNINLLLQHRAVCLYDDTLLSFQYWIVDSEPYCSSLLGIHDVTKTLPPATSRT